MKKTKEVIAKMKIQPNETFKKHYDELIKKMESEFKSLGGGSQ